MLQSVPDTVWAEEAAGELAAFEVLVLRCQSMRCGVETCISAGQRDAVTGLEKLERFHKPALVQHTGVCAQGRKASIRLFLQ